MIITTAQAVTFGLVFTRTVVMVLMSPVFSNKEIFSLAKITFIFWVCGLLIFYIPLPQEFPLTPITFLFAMLTEAMIGAILGFVAQLLLIGLEFAGNLMDTQAGLSVASQLDPSTGQATTLISKLMKTIALLVFLLIDGHHVILATLIQSFQALPIGSPFQLSQAALHVANSGALIFELALQLSAPILLIVFLIDFGFGMLSRVAPQVNVFQLGFQLKPIVSLFIFLSIVPGLVDLMYYLLERVSENMLEVLFILRL